MSYSKGAVPGFLAASRAFTLLEVIAAVTLSALLLAALVPTFFSALSATEKNDALATEQLRQDRFSRLFLNDVKCMAPPVGVLAGAVTGTKEEEGDIRLDRLEFQTTSGAVEGTEPWGDLMRVAYYLTETDIAGTYTLTRAVTRNLLAVVSEEPAETTLLEDVASLGFEYYDGEQWVDSWDSTTTENQSPEAVRVSIRFATESAVPPPPLQIVTPVIAKAVSTSSQGA